MTHPGAEVAVASAILKARARWRSLHHLTSSCLVRDKQEQPEAEVHPGHDHFAPLLAVSSSLTAMGVFKVLLPLRNTLKFKLISPISKECCLPFLMMILCRAIPPKLRTLFSKDSVHNYYQLFISPVVRIFFFFSFFIMKVLHKHLRLGKYREV